MTYTQTPDLTLPSLKGAKAPRKPRRMARDTEAAPKEPKAPRESKASALIAELQESEHGITRDTLLGLTGWQGHTLRAFLSGLRKKGHEVITGKAADGTTTYRIAKEG